MLIFRGRDLTTFVAHWGGAPVFGVRVGSAFEWIPFSIFVRRPDARIQGASRSQVSANRQKDAGFGVAYSFYKFRYPRRGQGVRGRNLDTRL